MRTLGRSVTIIACSDPKMVGFRGTLALESMRMITIVSAERRVSVAKTGTVLRLDGTDGLVECDGMNGRVEDRLSRGSRV